MEPEFKLEATMTIILDLMPAKQFYINKHIHSCTNRVVPNPSLIKASQLISSHRMKYVIEDGLRKVVPYYKTYTTHIKTRWEGRTIMEVFTKELGQREDTVRKEIVEHKIYVQQDFGKKSDALYIKGWDLLEHRKIRQHDVIHNTKHMHEPAVIVDSSIAANNEQTLVNIISHDSDYLVVNKPAGVPVHPTLNYNYNSLTEILKSDLNLPNLWTTYRLDKVTLGLLIFGLNKVAASRILTLVSEKLDSGCSKTYFARVKGNFPDECTYTCPILLVNTNNGYLMPSNQQIPGDSTTKFKKISYNENFHESIVECTPISGKMHQIRIHLRNLGYPISNDWVYNPVDDEMNRIKNDFELWIYDRIFQAYNIPTKLVNLAEVLKPHQAYVETTLEEIKRLAMNKLDTYRSLECEECQRQLFDLERERTKSSIYLHAYRYKCSEFDFKTPIPSWCDI